MDEHVTTVKNGVIPIPRALLERAGIHDGDLVVVKTSGKRIVIEPLQYKPTLANLDPSLIDKVLREADEEEKRLEAKKLRDLLTAIL